MTKNQMRIARQKQEYETPGTLQYFLAHRQPKPRRWMLGLHPETFKRLWTALMAGKVVKLHRKEQEAK